MDLKPKPNRRLYLEILKKMGPEKRLDKVFELNNLARELFLTGLKRRFPQKSEAEIKAIYLERIKKCYNKNY